MKITVERLYEVTEATWPPAAKVIKTGWCIRNGAGGGKRVSAATMDSPEAIDAIEVAEGHMRDSGQEPLFMIRAGETDLDTALATRGYDIIDPVNLYVAPVDALATERPPRVSMFSIWDPLQIQYDIWQAGGIGDARFEVMKRSPAPKTSIVSRWDDHPAGTAFVGIDNDIAMLHALEILPHQRKKGVAKWLMRHAAFWAKDNGATHISVVCTQRNEGANALYASLGMELVGQYHYRIKKT